MNAYPTIQKFYPFFSTLFVQYRLPIICITFLLSMFFTYLLRKNSDENVGEKDNIDIVYLKGKYKSLIKHIVELREEFEVLKTDLTERENVKGHQTKYTLNMTNVELQENKRMLTDVVDQQNHIMEVILPNFQERLKALETALEQTDSEELRI